MGTEHRSHVCEPVIFYAIQPLAKGLAKLLSLAGVVRVGNRQPPWTAALAAVSDEIGKAPDPGIRPGP